MQIIPLSVQGDFFIGQGAFYENSHTFSGVVWISDPNEHEFWYNFVV